MILYMHGYSWNRINMLLPKMIHMVILELLISANCSEMQRVIYIDYCCLECTSDLQRGHISY